MILVIKIPSEENVVFAVDRKVTRKEKNINKYSKEIKIKTHKNVAYAFSETPRFNQDNTNYDKELDCFLIEYPEIDLPDALIKCPFTIIEPSKVALEEQITIINYAGFVDRKPVSGFFYVQERKLYIDENDSLFNPKCKPKDNWFPKVEYQDSHYKRLGEIVNSENNLINDAQSAFYFDDIIQHSHTDHKSLLYEINKMSCDNKIEIIKQFYCRVQNDNIPMIGFGMDIKIIFPDKEMESERIENCNHNFEIEREIKVLEGRDNISAILQNINELGVEHYEVKGRIVKSLIIPFIKNEANQYEYSIEIDPQKEKVGFEVAVETMINLIESENSANESKECKLIIYQKETPCKEN